MATITLNERTYDLLAIDKLTFSDQRKLKKITGGMSLSKIAEGLDEMDADAWFGVVLLSVQRANPRFTETELGNVNMVDLLAAMKDEDEDEDDAVPPTSLASTGDGVRDTSTSSSDGAETPGTLGTPTLPASSE